VLTEINGLPAHVLLIHAIVVLAPLGALATVASVFSPTARRRIGVVSPALCLVVLVLTPITTNAGEWLEHKVTDGQPAGSDFARKVERHADLGDTFLWFAIALFVVSTAVWWLGRRTDAQTDDSRRTDDATTGGGTGGGATATATRATVVPVAVRYAVAAVAVLVSVVTVYQLLRIGDSGATATWGR
jgi:hypothetical protein